MLPSLNYESIPEDALFGSGTDSWNNRSNGRTAQGEPAMTAQRRDVYDADINQVSQPPGRQRVATGNTSAGASNETHITLATLATPTSSQVANQNSRQTHDEPVVRPKDIKNKENRNRNGVRLSQSKNVNCVRESGATGQAVSRSANKDWAPALQVKRYDNDTVNTSSNNILRPSKKVSNSSKQKKDNINMNLNQTGHRQSVTQASEVRLQLPTGLNPNANPSHIDHIYINNANPSPGRSAGMLLLPNRPAPLTGNSTDIQSGLSVEKIQESPTITQYKNKWPGQERIIHRDIKVENRNDTSPSNLLLNDLEMDSEQPNANNTSNIVLELPSQRAVVQRHPSSSNLASSPIIVSYDQRRSLSDSSLQLHGSPLSQGSLNSSVGSSPVSNTFVTVTFTTVPTSSFTTTVISPSHQNCDSLSSTWLFGDGRPTLDGDRLIAQQLQHQFNMENQADMRRNNYDIPPSFQARGSQSPRIDSGVDHYLAALTDSQLSLNDFNDQTVQGFDIQNSPTNSISNFNPVGYRTSDVDIDIHGERNSPIHNEPNVVTVPYIQQETVPIPETLSPEPILVPYDSGETSLSLPEPANTGHSTFIRASSSRTADPRDNRAIAAESGAQTVTSRDRGSSRVETFGQTRTTSTEDASLVARRIQEQEDEELARALQAQEDQSNDTSYHSNHYRSPQGRPLHALIDTGVTPNWTNRPLRVGPVSRAINNNVADSRSRGQSGDRPLQVLSRRNVWPRGGNDEYAMLDYVHDISPNEGYDIPPSQDYYYRYEYDPDYMQDEHGEDRLISMNRDPQLLASLLVSRAPNMIIPSDVDLNDYEALWELAENLGEVRRVGMDPEEISRLPVHTYQPSNSGSGEDSKTDCLVCMSEFCAGEQLRTLPCCHLYHLNCIDEWLRRNAICPICRQSAK